MRVFTIHVVGKDNDLKDIGLDVFAAKDSSAICNVDILYGLTIHLHLRWAPYRRRK